MSNAKGTKREINLDELVAKASTGKTTVEEVKPENIAAEKQAVAAANAALKAAIDANTELSAREAEKTYASEKKKFMLNKCKNDDVVERTISKLYAPILGKTYSYYFNGIVITVYCDGKPHKYPRFVAENIDRKLNKISESNTYKEVIEERTNQDGF